jgi:hypothetical protein
MGDKLLSGEIEPASFGIVDRYATLGAASDEMEWCACALATQIPERNVHGREGEAHGRAYRIGVSVKEQPFPNLLYHLSVATEQPRRHIVPQQRDDRGSASADRVAVACTVHSVVGPDADHRGFLFAERLNCVATQHFRRQINLENFNARYLWHTHLQEMARL